MKNDMRNVGYYEGWVLLNEVIGILSFYATNLMYSFNSLTLLTASKNQAKKLSSRLSESDSEITSEEGDPKPQNSPLYMRIRKGVLYLLIPFCMLFSVFSEMAFT
jgi:hypothetical protein